MNIDLSIYVIFSGITLIAAFYFGIHNITRDRSGAPCHSFTVLSFTVFFLSASSLIMLAADNPSIMGYFSHLLTMTIYLFPAALFHYVVEATDYNFFKKDIIKYFFYIPSAAIIFYLIGSGSIRAEKVSYGWTVSSDVSMRLGIFYMAPLLLLMIAYLSYNLKRVLRTHYPISRILVLLSGISVFALVTITMRPLMAILGLGIPINSFLMFLLFIFVATSNFLAELNTSSIAFKKMFETTEDCIMTVNNRGEILDINKKMQDILFPGGNSAKKGRKTPDSDEIKKRMCMAPSSKDSLNRLLGYFEEDSLEKLNIDIRCGLGDETRTFNVTASPVIYGRDRFIGKIAIFRDIEEKRKLEERLRQESIKDFLTDAYNRRYFYEILDNLISRFSRHKRPFCLIMIDIDNFKKLNDTYGHLQGDWLLKEIVGIIKDKIRKGIDSIVRYGGDEFAVILDESDIARAREVTERIIEGFKASDRKGTSLSIGISQYREGLGLEGLINEADSCMYEAKIDSSDAVRTAGLQPGG
jgi:diguanylate cyclase (GGDEF)-like protein